MGKLPPDTVPPQNNRIRVPKLLWRSTVAGVVAIVLYGVCLTGCVPAFFSKKPNPIPEPKTDQKAELIKPLIAASVAEDATDKTSAPEPGANKPGNAERTSETLHSSSKDARESSELSDALSDRPVQKKQTPGEDSKDRPLRVITKSEKVDAPNPPTEKIDLVGKEKSSDPGSEELEATSSAFKKHDHSKYVTDIRNKAIDQLNKEKDADLVRLCRNATTDQWSLTMYHRAERTYSFTDYAWDEVNLKWEKVLSSVKKPRSSWKQHLDFSAAGKECKILKGDPEKW